MPFEIGSAVNGGADFLCSSPLADGVLRNPVLTSLLITALALVIIHTLFRPALRRGGWQTGAKAGFWILVAVSAVTYAHYYALRRHLREEHAQKGIRDVVSSVAAAAEFQEKHGGGYAVYGPDGGPPPAPDGAPPPAPDGGPPPAPDGGPAPPLPSADRPDNVAPPSGGDPGGLDAIEAAVLPSQAAPGRA